MGDDIKPVVVIPISQLWPPVILRPCMGVILNPKMAFIFPISCILALIFQILIKNFPKCEGKGSFLKSQIKSLTPVVLIKLTLGFQLLAS